NEVYQDALGARVIPDPTTAGDFCRRFTEADVETLLKAIDQVRMKVWRQQPAEFFAEAIIEVLGTGNVLVWQGDAKAGLPWMEEAVRMWRDLGDSREAGLAIEAFGWAQFTGGDDLAARATFEECLRIQREADDPVLVNRAMVDRKSGV